MNKRKEYQNLLQQANEDLSAYGKHLELDKEGDTYYSLLIHYSDDSVECYAENYYEHELDELITDAWYYAKFGPKRPRNTQEKKDEITKLFKRLSPKVQAEFLAELYHSLKDKWKDRFLKLTEDNS